MTSLVLSGSPLRLWRLTSDQQELEQQIEVTRSSTKQLYKQLKQAKDPDFIEKQAMDRFDFAEEHDLIFLFADEG